MNSLPISAYPNRCILAVTSNREFQVFLEFLWETGVRPLEAARLTAEQVDSDRQLLRVESLKFRENFHYRMDRRIRRRFAARITEKEYADGSKEVYSYDLAGRLVQVVDPAGRTRSFGYAVDNNLLSLTYPQGTGTASVGFTYSPVYNRVATMVDPTGTTSYGYNALGALGGGRVSSVDGPLANDTITYQYDALGRVTQRAINGVARNFVFGDALGRLTQETNSLGQFDYAYDGATSRLATVSAPNGMTTAMSYRALPQDRLLRSITHTGPGSTAISSFEYAYDATGNITHWTQNQSANTVLPVAQWTLSQDGSDQLTGVSVAGHPELSESYSYDNGGNRLTWQKGDAVTTSAYNVLNQLNTVSGGGKFRVAGTTSEPADVTVQGQPAQMLSPTNFVARPNVTAGTNTITVAATDGSGNTKTNGYQVVVPSTAARSFSYDGNGNLLGDGVRTYEWDGLNRMVKVTKGSDVYEFGYDGLNRRVSETKNGSLVKRFVWDGLALAEERDASNVITKRFLPQGEMQGTTSYFYTRDHLGSIRELTATGGSVAASYAYDAWGRGSLLSGTDLASFGYTGHYTHNGTDLVLAPFRAYDTGVGRWTSRDPIGEEGGVNLYGYVANSSIDHFDPSGLKIVYRRRNEPGYERFWENFEKNLQFLLKSTEGQRMWSLAECSSEIIEIGPNDKDLKLTAREGGRTWKYPNGTIKVALNQNNMWPTRSLAHELQHSLEKAYHVPDPANLGVVNPMDSSSEAFENRGTRAANLIGKRGQDGYGPTRVNSHGVTLPEFSGLR